MNELLRVEELTIAFAKSKPVVENVGFSVQRGETRALVGESGSGKTLSCRAALRLLPRAARVLSGRVLLNGPQESQDLLTLNQRQMCFVRGSRISMIFQEPMRSLSPLHRIGDQVAEVLRVHGQTNRDENRKKVLAKFERVGFAHPERIWRAYPFELSGGMRQRAMIAMAMVGRPDILIADEPTTALDVTTQAQVLGLIKDIQNDTGMAVILVTHDLGVVANMADSVTVMHRGRVMEAGPSEAVLSEPAHAYTKQLFEAAPIVPDEFDQEPADADPDYILEMRNVSKSYFAKGVSPWAEKVCVRAVQNVDFAVRRGQTLAVVGESGSGKTTCARLALGAELADPGGSILFRANPHGPPVDLQTLSAVDRLRFQEQAQMVFQDPYSTLNPRMRVKEALTEPLEIHRIGTRSEQADRAAEMLNWVGLSPNMLTRYPHAFSGGQRQRLSIARALMLDPIFLVCDEPTSALDVSVQEQILELLEDIREKLNLSYLFISHDLAVVARIADEVAVMRQGVVVERASPERLFHNPRHPYTKALIAAQPQPDISRPIDLRVVAQGAGAPESWPETFRFDPTASPPPLGEIEPDHWVRHHV